MKIKTILVLLLLYVVPILILKAYAESYVIRVPLLTIVAGFVIVLSRKKKPQDLGFSKPFYGFKQYMILLCVLLTGILLLKLLFQPEWISIDETIIYGLFIPTSIFQEYLYRSYLHAKLKEEGLFIYLIVSSLLFGLLHMVFNNPGLMFLISFLGGLAFSYVFWKKPNIYLVSLVHIVANFFAVWFGFFN